MICVLFLPEFAGDTLSVIWLRLIRPISSCRPSSRPSRLIIGPSIVGIVLASGVVGPILAIVSLLLPIILAISGFVVILIILLISMVVAVLIIPRIIIWLGSILIVVIVLLLAWICRLIVLRILILLAVRIGKI